MYSLAVFKFGKKTNLPIVYITIFNVYSWTHHNDASLTTMASNGNTLEEYMKKTEKYFNDVQTLLDGIPDFSKQSHLSPTEKNMAVSIEILRSCMKGVSQFTAQLFHMNMCQIYAYTPKDLETSEHSARQQKIQDWIDRNALYQARGDPAFLSEEPGLRQLVAANQTRAYREDFCVLTPIVLPFGCNTMFPLHISRDGMVYSIDPSTCYLIAYKCSNSYKFMIQVVAYMDDATPLIVDISQDPNVIFHYNKNLQHPWDETNIYYLSELVSDKYKSIEYTIPIFTSCNLYNIAQKEHASKTSRNDEELEILESFKSRLYQAYANFHMDCGPIIQQMCKCLGIEEKMEFVSCEPVTVLVNNERKIFRFRLLGGVLERNVDLDHLLRVYEIPVEIFKTIIGELRFESDEDNTMWESFVRESFVKSKEYKRVSCI